MSLAELTLLVLLTGFVAVAILICVYHLFLMFIALIFRGKRGCNANEPCKSFAIVIPAHNEEANITKTLDSCAALEYPPDKIAVYVIADNCSDKTVEVVAKHGVTCLVRCDETRRGKGFALEWAIPQVLSFGHDAVLVLDADCEIDAQALIAFNSHLISGNLVLQADYVVANPDRNARTYLLALANTLENDFFYTPKSKLGMAVFLRGTGMVLHRDILARFPWHAKSIVEDAEYSAQLLQNGHRITYVPETRVISPFPDASTQLAVQRARWIGGGIRSLASSAPQLLWRGIRTRRAMFFDAVLNMLIVSRPFIIAQFTLSLFFTLITWITLPGRWSELLLASCLITVAGYVAYVFFGVIRLGISRKRIGFLVCTPIQIVEYLLISLRSLFRFGSDGWQRTPRIL